MYIIKLQPDMKLNINDFFTQPFDSDEVASFPESDDVVQVIIKINKNESAVEPAETRLDVRICGRFNFITFVMDSGLIGMYI